MIAQRSLLLALLFVATVTPSSAFALAPLFPECRHDSIRFCAGIQDIEWALDCLESHRRHLSPWCRNTLESRLLQPDGRARAFIPGISK